MDKEFLNKIKEKVVAGAQTSKLKIEEAARAGKLHMKIMAEKRKLSKAHASLGKETYLAIQKKSISKLTSRTGVKDILKSVKSSVKKIEALEKELFNEVKDAEVTC